MSYIVVPALPRDALVEWQVISHNSPQDWQCECFKVSSYRKIPIISPTVYKGGGGEEPTFETENSFHV